MKVVLQTDARPHINLPRTLRYYMHDELALIAASPACALRPNAGSVRKYPQPSAAAQRREAALREALLSGAIPMRDPLKMAMLKPKPMMFDPDLSHIGNCTWCINQDAARSAARRHSLRMSPYSVHLLVDDAPLALWSDNIVHELERPRKARVEFDLLTAQQQAQARQQPKQSFLHNLLKQRTPPPRHGESHRR